MKKIYFYLPEYPETPTGGIKYHKILFEYFRKVSNEIYLLGNTVSAKIADRNKLFKMIFGFYFSMRVEKKSIIILTNTAFLHFIIPMILNRFYKRHIYFMIVHHLVRSENPEYFRTKFEEYFIRNSDYIMTISETTLNEIHNYGILKNNKIKIIPPGLDNVKSEKHINISSVKRLKILFVGTIELRKGLIYGIDAMNALKDIDVELNIIGSHFNSEKYYENILLKVKNYALENKVYFRGRVSDKVLSEFYDNSDLFLFPTLWEGYGMVVAEAMSHGLPVISSDISSLRQIVDDGINGFLVETRKSELLSEKIKLLYNNRKLLSEFSISAIKKAKTFQSWEVTCTSVFSEVIKFR